MPKCEKCGTSFAYTASTGEVTSARVLCPPCEAERRAAKSAQGLRTGNSPAPAALPALPSSRPAGNPGPAAAAPKTPTHAFRPTVHAPARPAPGPVRPAAGGRAVVAPARPAPAPPADEPARHPHALPPQPKDKVLLIGWIAAAVFLVVGGGVVLFIKSKKDREHAAAEAHDKAVRDVATAMRAFNLDLEADCRAAIKLAKEHEELWKNESIAADITSLVARANSNLEILKEKGDLEARLRNVQERLKNPDALSPEELLDLRRKIDELEIKGSNVGADFVAGLGTARNTGERSLAERLHEDAKGFASANPDKGIAALAKYKLAEDEIEKLLERAVRGGAKEAQELFTKHYREVQDESNALCATVLTPDVIAKTPWRDLLAPDQVREWVVGAVQGFSWRIDKGVLSVEFLAKDAKKDAILSVGDREKWRDFALEFDVVPESGKFDLFVRLGLKADLAHNLPAFVAGTESGQMAPGKPQTVAVTCIGNQVTYRVGEEEPYPEEIKWMKSRRGSVGLVIPEGTKFRITRMRIRVLR